MIKNVKDERTDIVELIGKKLQITVTISIFFILVVRTFFENYTVGNEAKVHLAFAGLVALYILCLGTFWSIRKENMAPQKNLQVISSLLNINLFLMGFIIILSGSVEKLNQLPEKIKSVVGFIIILTAIAILLIPIFILFAFGGIFSDQLRLKRKK